MFLCGSFMIIILLLVLCDGVLVVMLDLVLDFLVIIYNWWIWVFVEFVVHIIEVGVVDVYNFDYYVWMSMFDNLVVDWFGGYFFEGN